MMRTVLSGLVVALMQLAAVDATAYDTLLPHPFTSASITWEPIPMSHTPRWHPIPLHVAHDGKTYTHVTGRRDDLQTRVRLQASVEPGYRIYGFVVIAGQATFSAGNGAHFPPLERVAIEEGVAEQTLDLHRPFELPAADVVAGAFPPDLGPMHPMMRTPTRTPPVPAEQQIVRLCNDRYPEGPPSTTEPLIPLNVVIHAAFSAGKERPFRSVTWEVWRPDHASGRTAVAHAVFPVRLSCAGN